MAAVFVRILLGCLYQLIGPFHHPAFVVFVQNAVAPAEPHHPAGSHERQQKALEYDTVKTGYASLDQSGESLYKIAYKLPQGEDGEFMVERLLEPGFPLLSENGASPSSR